MSGVEILSTKEIVAKTTFNTTAFWITMGIVVVVFFIIGIIGTIREGESWLFIPSMLAAGIIVGGLVGFFIGSSLLATPAEYKTRYKVTISDEVAMNDFVDKYKIISQEGKIFTIEEKAE